MACLAHSYHRSSLGEKPAGRNLKLSSRETSVPDCRFETDLQIEVHPTICISRMLNPLPKRIMSPCFQLSGVPSPHAIHVVRQGSLANQVHRDYLGPTGWTALGTDQEWHWWCQLVGFRFPDLTFRQCCFFKDSELFALCLSV